MIYTYYVINADIINYANYKGNIFDIHKSANVGILLVLLFISIICGVLLIHVV